MITHIQATTFFLPGLRGGSVSEGSPETLSFDASDIPDPSAIVSGTLTLQWSDGGGFAWSSDVLANFGNGFLPATTGAANNGNTTELFWDFNLPVGAVTSTFQLPLVQANQRGGIGNFSRLVVSLSELELPSIQGTILPNTSTVASYDSALWYQFNHRGGLFDLNTNGSTFDNQIGLYAENRQLIESDDDGGIGLDSSIVRQDLDAGTYFVAFSNFFTAFDDNFSISDASSSGDLVINFTAVPEPSSALLVCLPTGLIARRRRER